MEKCSRLESGLQKTIASRCINSHQNAARGKQWCSCPILDPIWCVLEYARHTFFNVKAPGYFDILVCFFVGPGPFPRGSSVVICQNMPDAILLQDGDDASRFLFMNHSLRQDSKSPMRGEWLYSVLRTHYCSCVGFFLAITYLVISDDICSRSIALPSQPSWKTLGVRVVGIETRIISELLSAPNCLRFTNTAGFIPSITVSCPKLNNVWSYIVSLANISTSDWCDDKKSMP